MEKDKKIEPEKLVEKDALEVFEQAPLSICILTGARFRVEFANHHCLQMVGKTKKIITKPLFDCIPELETQGFRPILEGVMATGEPYSGNEMPLEFVRNETLGTGFFNFVCQPLRREGVIGGIIIITHEVTEEVLERTGLADQLKKVQNVIMTAPAFFCTMMGPDHVFDLVNEQYQQLFGARKIQGKPIMDALPELEGQDLEALLDRVYQKGEHFMGIDVPITLAHDVGLEPELRYFSFSYQPMYDDDEQVNGVLCFGYEVTETVVSKNKSIEAKQKHVVKLEKKVKNRTAELAAANQLLTQKNHELELSKEKLLSEYSRRLIEASHDPLIVLSADGKITDMNNAMIEVAERSREQLIGADFSDFFTEPKKASEGVKLVFQEGFVVDFPLTIIDHKLTDVLFNGSVYKDDKGKVLGAVVVARDITEQKRVSNELNEARIFAEMATSIAEKAKSEAEKATERANEAVKSKQQFLSNMSHEIRTPMNAIIGFTKVMLKTDMTTKQKEYVQAIKLSGDALIVLINDILDLAKVDAGKMSFEKKPFKMAFSVSSMLQLFETKIQEKNLTLLQLFDPRIPAVLVGDSVRLHQIILNLMSNAVKFTHSGTVTMQVLMLEENDDAVKIQFSVADSGIGIDQKSLKSIFDNFHQATSSTAREFGGTGLGLAIVKQLVEAQGGSVAVKSEKGNGSTFSFILDFEKTSSEAADEIDFEFLETDIKKIRVLVVEDMALNQLLMKTLLDEFGFEREIAENGQVALEKMAKKDFDIILMDLQMPVMNGFETTKHIRNVLHSNIPIIALTADVTTMDLEKCTAVGMNDYIAKPVDERLLYSKIVHLVKKTAQNEAINEAQKAEADSQLQKFKYTDLEYLNRRTRSNPVLMTEMIDAFLEQTPPLIRAMKTSFQDHDWQTLYSAIHKMIPSFSIMGMSVDFENMAKKVQKFAATQQETDGIQDLVLKLETVCSEACVELKAALLVIKKTNPA